MFAVLLLAGIVAVVVLPARLAQRLLPELAGRLGFASSSVAVRRLDLFGADLGPLRLGTASAPVLRVDAIRAAYTPVGLLARRIDRVTLSGVQLRAELTGDGRLVIPELDLAAWRSPGPAAEAGRGPSSPWSVGRGEIRHATLALTAGGRTYRIPLEAEVSAGAPGEYRIEVRVFPRGEGIVVTGSLRESSPGVVEVRIPQLELGRFADLSERLAGLHLRGDLALDGSYRPDRGEFRVKGRVAGLEVRHGAVSVQAVRLADGHFPPVEFQAEGDGKEIRFRVDRLQVTSPVGLAVAMPQEGILRRRPDRTELSVPLRLILDPAASGARWAALPLAPTAPMSLSLQVNAGWDPAGNWDVATVPEMPVKPWLLAGPAGEASWTWRQIQLRGRGQGGHGDVKVALKAGDVGYRRAGMSVSFPSVDLNADAKLGAGGIMASGVLKASAGQAMAGELRAEGFAATLPWRWPAANREQDLRVVVARGRDLGRVAVAELRFRDLALGRLEAELYQDGLGYVFIARHDGVLPGVSLAASGLVEHRPETGLAAALELGIDELPEHGVELDLAKFAPALGEAVLAGRPELSGKVSWAGGRLAASGQAGLSQGRFIMPGKNLRIEGIEARVAFPDLATMRSAPRQRLRFASARFGNLEFGKADMRFQVEPGNRLFLEQAEVAWCGGKLSGHALRYRPGQAKNLQLTLFCDRLLLADVLRQLGIANAEGEGTVSGQLPLAIIGEVVDLSGGFLYSKPGQGGVLHLVDAGLFAGAQQSLQVAIAREALRDYTYEWVTINLDRDGQDLLVRMEMSGRPSRSMPFGFTPRQGLFQADPDGSWRANFQGIGFRFNFRLPLEQVLEYGKEMGGILGEAAE
jgi:hypothetical protein